MWHIWRQFGSSCSKTRLCKIMSVLNCWQKGSTLISRRDSHEPLILKLIWRSCRSPMSVRNSQKMLKGWLCRFMQYIQVLTILTEICWNFFDLPRTGFLILLYSVVSVGLWLKPSGARLVWSSFNEGSDKGNDERALMRLHDLSQLLAFHTLLRWPQTPCHRAHTCPCACHELFSFDLGRRVDPVRFSLIFGFPMAYGAVVVLQQFAFINAAALRNGGHKFSCRANFVSKPANSAWKRKSANSAMSRDWRQHRAEKQHLSILIISGLFFDSSTAVELNAVHGLHGIDVAHLETTSPLLSHLTLWLFLGPKQCNFKRRQSWALHIEAISTTQEYPCCKFKEWQSMLKG